MADFSGADLRGSRFQRTDFATDSWVGRAILGDPSPWNPLDLPWDEMPDVPGVPRDLAVLAARVGD
jgi:hypothetical protein